MVEWSVDGFTLGPEPGIRARWHRGRERYAVWLARLEDPRLRPRLRAAREALRPWIRPIPYRDLHVTLWVAGFPALNPTFNDDVPEAALAHQAARLRRLPAFDVEVLDLRSFASAAYLAVRDLDGGIAELRAALAGTHREQRFGPYAPHVTVGAYTRNWPADPIEAAMEPLRGLAPLRLRVRAIERVDLNARRAGAPLLPAQVIPLEGS